jgi:hypothetical protein
MIHCYILLDFLRELYYDARIHEYRVSSMQLQQYRKCGVRKNCSCFRNCFRVGMLRVADIDRSLLVRGELKL